MRAVGQWCASTQGGVLVTRGLPLFILEVRVKKGNYGDRNGKSRASSGTPPGKHFGEFRFANIEFTAQEREDFKLQFSEGEFEGFSIAYWLEQGYKVSFSLGNAGTTCTCSISCKEAGHPNSGLIITGRGRDPATALASVSYKIHVLCADGLWGEGAERRGGVVDGVG